jgi:pteridine reductase
MDLKGKVALITGAGRRVGSELAVAFAARGATVGVHYRSSISEADKIVERIVATGRKAKSFRADLEHVSEIDRMVAEVAAAFGGLDILINSASTFFRRPIEEVTERDWDVNMATNLKAPFFLAKAAAPAMRRAGAGKVINIGDWAGVRPYNNYLPYVVSKGGLITLTRALAKALAPEIQVNCVALGPVLAPEDYGADEIERMVAGTLVKKMGSPKDVVAAVMFLCEGTDFATGSTLLLDGGRLLV